MTPAEFEKKFPQKKFRRTTLTVVPDNPEEGEEAQEIMVVEETSKPVSRIAWLVVGGIAMAAGFYAFRRFGPQQAPTQMVMLPPAPPVDPGAAALAEMLGDA